MEEERLVMSGFREEDDDQESSLRPKTLRDDVGQQVVKDSLNIYIQAARALNQVRDQADTADKLILLAVRQLSAM